MEEIEVGLCRDLDVVDWNDVDTILAEPQFSKLRTFRIYTDLDLSVYLIDNLPRCYARNILSIQPHRWKLAVL